MKFKYYFDKLIHPEEHSLKIKSLRAAAWSILERGASQFFRMVGSLILTRILYPEAFGIMATATMLLVMMQIVSETGGRAAIIQNPRGGTPAFLNAAWVIAILKGVVLCGVMLAGAGPAASFYNQPDLEVVLWVISLNPLIRGFENPAISLVIKQFRIEKKLVLTVSTQVFGLFCSIGLSLWMHSVTALAIGNVLATVFNVGLSYGVEPYRPRFQWEKTAGGELLRFGRVIFLNTIIVWVAMNADVLIVGRILSMKDLGVYNIGRNIGLLLWMVFVQMLWQSYFPAVSAAVGDLPRVGVMYRRTLALVLSLVVPAALVLSLCAGDIVRLLYDPRYEDAAISLFWVSLSSIFLTMSAANGNTFIALGRTVYETIAAGVGAFFVLLLVPLGARYHGVAGAAAGLFGAYVVIVMMEGFFLYTKIKMSGKLVLRPWLQVGGTAAVSAAVFAFLGFLLDGTGSCRLLFILSAAMISTAASAGVYVMLEGRRPFSDQVVPATKRPEKELP